MVRGAFVLEGLEGEDQVMFVCGSSQSFVTLHGSQGFVAAAWVRGAKAQPRTSRRDR